MIQKFFCNKAHTLACNVKCDMGDFYYNVCVVGEGTIHRYKIEGPYCGKGTLFAANMAFKLFRAGSEDGNYSIQGNRMR